MPQTQVRPSPVGVSAPGGRGGKTSGGAAPGQKTRETVGEAEAAHSRVAAETETGEARKSHACPRRGKGGEEEISEDKKEDKKPETERMEDEKFKGWVIVKPRPLPCVKPRREVTVSQKKPKTERKEDVKKRINEELEFLIEMEDRIPRKEEKWDYRAEQLVEEGVDEAMAELRRALPPEELEIYERCYRIFKRTSSAAIRLYTSEQILERALKLRGEK